MLLEAHKKGLIMDEKTMRHTEETKKGGTYNAPQPDIMEGEQGEREFRRTLGIRFVERREGYAKGEMNISPSHLNVLGVIHGGVLFSLADTVSGASALGRGGRVTTVNGNINYLKAGKDTSKIVAEAHEIKYGRTLSVCEAKVYDDKDNLLATTTMTFFHLKD